MNKSRRIALIISIILILFLMYLSVYHQMTGLYPIPLMNSPKAILPPEIDAKGQTYDQVVVFIKNDDTNTITYKKGFNCVDSSFRVFLNARWAGIVAIPVGIVYERPPDHMIIGFPTVDHGDVFFETENDMEVMPRVGGYYDGEKIVGLYYLNIVWKPLDNSPEYQLKLETQ